MSKNLVPIFPSRIFVVSSLTFKSLIHFEFIFVYSFTCLSSFSNTIYWRYCLYLIIYSCLLCHGLIDHIGVGLFLGSLFFLLKKDFIYLFLQRGKEKEKERERNINVWLPLVCPLMGTWSATQACVLTGNWTSNPLLHSPAFNPLSHISQGLWKFVDYWLICSDFLLLLGLG